MTVDPSGKFVYAVNQYHGNVSVYTINALTGVLTEVAGSPFGAGSYSRFVSVEPSGRFAYVLNPSLVQDIAAYTIDAGTGALTPIICGGSCSGSNFLSGSSSESMTFDPSGKFAYVANYFSNNVWVYAIRAWNGDLNPVDIVTAGTNPRSISVDPSGRFAYAANYRLRRCFGLRHRQLDRRIDQQGHGERGEPILISSPPPARSSDHPRDAAGATEKEKNMFIKRGLIWIPFLFVLVMLASCGGGGGGASSGAQKAWGIAVPIEFDAGTAASPQIAVNAAGDAFAVWVQSDGTRNNIWSTRYIAGYGMNTPTLIETNDAGTAVAPQIAIDSQGNALAVWYQSDGARNNIWANRYTIGSGWGARTLIETIDTGSAIRPQLAIDTQGNALAVWEQWDGAHSNIWANRYTADSATWGTAVLIETNNAGDAFVPQIVFDENGTAMAVWEQSDGTRHNIWANRYTVVTDSWGTAVLIETNDAGSASMPQIAIDRSGNALAVWEQTDGPRDNIWANRYSITTKSWGTAVLLETGDGHAANPDIAIDSNGNALAGWVQDGSLTANARYDIWANRYTVGTGWGTAELIETDNTGWAVSPNIAFDPQWAMPWLYGSKAAMGQASRAMTSGPTATSPAPAGARQSL